MNNHLLYSYYTWIYGGLVTRHMDKSVLGKLPPRKIAPPPDPNSNTNPKPNPNPSPEAIFLGNNFSETDKSNMNKC